MVFFTCNNCGESVKKPSVEKHYSTRCRNNAKNVSCMDCQKDFHGEDYVAHTKCITEAEKYSGKNYVPKENQNKGQKKQETWMDIVRSILESTEYKLSAQTRNIFQRLQNYDNVPRKKAKFQNFVANCLRIPANQAQPVWDVLEKELENMKNIKQQETAAAKLVIEKSEDTKETPNKQQNGLKRKQDDNNAEEKVVHKKKKKNNNNNIVKEIAVAESIEKTDVFQWSLAVEKVVAKHPQGLSLDKLKKKLLKKYKSNMKLEDLSEKQQKKFEKKFAKTLKKSPSVKVDGEVVQPC